MTAILGNLFARYSPINKNISFSARFWNVNNYKQYQFIEKKLTFIFVKNEKELHERFDPLLGKLPKKLVKLMSLRLSKKFLANSMEKYKTPLDRLCVYCVSSNNKCVFNVLFQDITPAKNDNITYQASRYGHYKLLMKYLQYNYLKTQYAFWGACDGKRLKLAEFLYQFKPKGRRTAKWNYDLVHIYNNGFNKCSTFSKYSNQLKEISDIQCISMKVLRNCYKYENKDYFPRAYNTFLINYCQSFYGVLHSIAPFDVDTLFTGNPTENFKKIKEELSAVSVNDREKEEAQRALKAFLKNAISHVGNEKSSTSTRAIIDFISENNQEVYQYIYEIYNLNCNEPKNKYYLSHPRSGLEELLWVFMYSRKQRVNKLISFFISYINRIPGGVKTFISGVLLSIRDDPKDRIIKEYAQNNICDPRILKKFLIMAQNNDDFTDLLKSIVIGSFEGGNNELLRASLRTLGKLKNISARIEILMPCIFDKHNGNPDSKVHYTIHYTSLSNPYKFAGGINVIMKHYGITLTQLKKYMRIPVNVNRIITTPEFEFLYNQ